MATAVTAIAGSTLLIGISSSLRTTDDNMRATIAFGMAEQLMDEIAGSRYAGVGDGPYQVSLGPSLAEAAGGGRQLFDDIDDYHRFTAGPPQDPWGIPLGRGQGDGTARNPNFQVTDGYFDAWRREAGLPSIRRATLLDVTHEAWRRGDRVAAWPRRFDAVVNANMIHITPWAAAEGLIEGASRYLSDEGFLYFYGPFKRDGAHTADSNAAFDDSLRSRNPEWGVRDTAAVAAVAGRYGFEIDQVVEMPANNLSLVLRKKR